ncbi:MAG: arginine--tRNA ligase [Candidatus Portnoybacteria bacterium RBG_13_40_8]|uniref:Arginine--tRNA ligase n=1 Tax=Candidatus Portnoybacteria bacterium RBG_13_40_8 TaxID=1801990 RepID=A0A1G2F5H7_9BACT|nr:MAG: arginine--tRNA ligase [Candidatus Portnoybacteria bacterium RBG_13_40_8]
MTVKDEIKSLISKTTREKVEFIVETPEIRNYGDYATNIALVLAKKLKKDPIQIAEEIKFKLISFLKKGDIIEKIEIVKPGFINLFLKPDFLQKELKSILKQDNKFGSQDIGGNKNVIIDYSSPNVAKPMHVGHLRSTIIGQAIYNLYKFLGYKTIGDNHLGDWGTQFGIMIAGCKKYKPNISNLEKITTDEMLNIYVKFNREIGENPDLQEVAKQEFKKLEDGDRENREIWRILRRKSLEDFNKIYEILKIKFDFILGESFYEEHLKEEVQHALKKKVAVTNSDGSIIIPLDEFNLIPFLIQKSDGATLYGTRDLATIRERVKKFKPEKIVYVIGNEQAFYLQQFFRAAELLGYISYNKLFHIKFGLVLDENHKKLATREGRVVSAEELINKVIELAEKIIKEKNPKLPDKERERAAKIIGIGALKYNDLSQNRQTDIVFDWAKMLSFEGNSGPYLQYTYVRLASIIRKTKLTDFNPKFLKEEKEIGILKELIRFPEIVRETAENFQINNLANYLFKLANSMNSFYESLPVLKAEENIKSARLALIKAASIVLRNGLNLLGIETLDKM